MSSVESNIFDSKLKGRKRGVPNYNVDILLNIVELILPTSAAAWHQVAEKYMTVSGESQMRDGVDIRRFF